MIYMVLTQEVILVIAVEFRPFWHWGEHAEGDGVLIFGLDVGVGSAGVMVAGCVFVGTSE